MKRYDGYGIAQMTAYSKEVPKMKRDDGRGHVYGNEPFELEIFDLIKDDPVFKDLRRIMGLNPIHEFIKMAVAEYMIREK